MATGAEQPLRTFDPAAFECFRFTARSIDEHGRVTLGYGLDEHVTFTEEFQLPVDAPLGERERERVGGLVSLLHWVAGVSYYKTALPPRVSCETGAPPPATARLLEALYSEGLAELAYENRLEGVTRPRFAHLTPPGSSGGDGARAPAASPAPTGEPATRDPKRVLVPVGGGKDSVVALEIVRRSRRELALFSVGAAAPIARTVAVAGLEHLCATRRLDSSLSELNRSGAINGHVPVTAIVSCVATLTAALHRFDAVAMANERSASSGNLRWDGIEVNHQFSKGLQAELLLRAALAESGSDVQLFSILRVASELAVARAFARMEPYHHAFTSCNAIFRIDPAARASSWCCDCPKCRFVFLALAPFSSPEHLRELFGSNLLADERQFEGFALLTATGGHKPFECVGEEQESIAAIRLLAREERWSAHAVVRRLVAEVLPHHAGDGDPAVVLTLGGEHRIPAQVLPDVTAVLAA